MATDYTSTINGYYQAVQFQNGPTADVTVYNAALNSGALTLAQVQAAIINDSVTSTIVDVVIREYQAAFNRVPDQAGLKYWVNAIEANPAMLTQLNVIFANSTEFQTRFGATANTTANTALVTALYTNVYGRAPDAAGLAYWAGSGLTAAQLLQAFSNAQEFVTMTSAAVTAFLQAEIAGNPPTTGSLFNLAGPSIPGSSFVFTTGIDALVGTNGNDTFTGDMATVTAADSVNGGAGVDTFNYFVGGAATLVVPSLNAVEVVNITGATGAQVANFTTASGLTNVNLKNESRTDAGADKITVGSGVAAGLDNVKSTVGAETFTFTSTQTSATLNISNGTNVQTVNLDGAAITTLNVNSAGKANTIATLASTGTENTLNITGGGDLTITNALADTVVTVNGSAATGKLNLTLGTTAAGKAVSVTTGSGNDTVDVTNTATNGSIDTVALGAGNDTLKVGAQLKNFGAGSTFDGGAGTDIVNITDGSTLTKATAALLTSFEVLDASGGTGTYDTSLLNTSKVQIDVGVNGNLAGAVTFSNLASTGGSLDIISAKSTDVTLAGAVTLTGKDWSGTSDSVTLNLVSVDGDNNGTAAGQITANVTTTGAEIVTVTSNISTIDAGLKATDYTNTLTLTDTSLKTLVISGNENVAFTALGATTTANLTKIDASASTGNVTVDYSSGVKAVTYLGSAGVDTISTTDGGTVYGAGGNDQVTLVATGANSDSIVYKSATDAQLTVAGSNVSAASTVETVTNFTTTNSGTATVAHDFIDISSIGGFTGYAAGAKTITGVDPLSGTFAASQTNFFSDGIGNRGVVLDVVGTDTYVFIDANHDGNFTASADLVIKLAGVANVTATDFNFG